MAAQDIEDEIRTGLDENKRVALFITGAYGERKYSIKKLLEAQDAEFVKIVDLLGVEVIIRKSEVLRIELSVSEC